MSENSNPKIYALCGDAEELGIWHETCKTLMGNGFLILPPTIFYYSWPEKEGQEYENKIKMQLFQISIADALFVVNNNETIDKDTWYYIGYAKFLGREIQSINPIDENKINEFALECRELFNEREEAGSLKSIINQEIANPVNVPKKFVENMSWFAGLIQELMLYKDNRHGPLRIDKYKETKEYKDSIRLIWKWLDKSGLLFLRNGLSTENWNHYIKYNKEHNKLEEEVSSKDSRKIFEHIGKSGDAYEGGITNYKQLYIVIQNSNITSFKGQISAKRHLNDKFGKILEALGIEKQWFGKGAGKYLCNAMKIDLYMDNHSVYYNRGVDEDYVLQDIKGNYINPYHFGEIFEYVLDRWPVSKEKTINYLTAIDIIWGLSKLLPIVDYGKDLKLISYEMYEQRKSIIQQKVMEYYRTHRAEPEEKMYEAYGEFFYELGKKSSLNAISVYVESIIPEEGKKILDDKKLDHGLNYLTDQLYNKCQDGIWDYIENETLFEKDKLVVPVMNYLKVLKTKIDAGDLADGIVIDDEQKLKEYYDYVCKTAYSEVFENKSPKPEYLMLNEADHDLAQQRLEKENNAKGVYMVHEDKSVAYVQGIGGQQNIDKFYLNKELESIDVIRRYKALLDEGAITEEEYNEKKKQLLNWYQSFHIQNLS